MLIKFIPVLAGRSKFLFTLGFILFSALAGAQIDNGSVKPGKNVNRTRDEKNAAFKADTLNGTNFYLTGLYQYTYRTLDDKSVSGFYDEWQNQTATYHKGFNVGLLMDLTEHLQVDIGASYFGNGEHHVYEDSLTDSSYTYQNTYLQLALPLRLRYHYGEKFQVFGYAGIAPLNILKLRYESSYVTEAGVTVEREEENQTNGFASFNLMVTGGVGFCYNVRYVGFMIYPEYRRHLFNTYSTKTIKVDHKMYSFGINAGLVFHF